MRNIATVDYSKLKKEYVKGNISYRELAKKHGVPFGTLRRVAAKEQWTQLRTQARARADTKIIEAVSDMEAQRVVDIISVADKLLGKIEEMIDTMAIDPQSLKQFTSALKDLKDIKGYKTEQDQLEQLARIEKYKRDAERDQDNGLTEIKVTFGSGEKDGQKWAE